MCHIVIFYDCPSHGDFCCMPENIINFFYIGFMKSNKYDNLVLKLIPTSRINKYIYGVAVCPTNNWIPGEAEAHISYTRDPENSLTTIEVRNPSRSNNLKLVYCHQNNGRDTFVRCGTLTQNFMPNIDVGYKCDEYNNEEANKITNNNEKESNMTFMSNNKLLCNGIEIYRWDPNVVTIFELGHNYNLDGNSFWGGFVHNKMNLHPGQKLHAIDMKYIHSEIENNKVDIHFGYAFMYQAKCKVPNMNATLRLRINETIKGFNTKIGQKLGRNDSFTFASREIENSSIGCHIVLDGFEHPVFNDFHGLLYLISLLVFDEKKEKYIKVDSVQNLVSNTKYTCILNIKGSNSKIERPHYMN